MAKLTCLCCFVLVLLLLGAQCDAFSASTSGGTKVWLAKTRETFKLSDLQYLEARLQARDYQCERLVLDAATGSSLLRICGEHFHQALQTESKKLPSGIKRCEWIASVLAYGDNAEELLTRIRDDGRFEEHDWEVDASWTLDYVRMNDIGATRTNSADGNEYTSKSLLSCIAQAIQIPAALNPATATDRLRVVDTDQGLFLTRLSREMQVNTEVVTTIKKWNSRPFPYSSAINPNVADILTTIVLDLVAHQRGYKPHQVSLLDPTCGSGTFLMFALNQGATVQGWDTNPSCVKGAQRNIQFMFGSKREKDCKIFQHDAGQIMPDTGNIDSMQFDCAIANFPWGENSALYHGETVRILSSLPRSLRRRAPCAFVSKDTELQQYMRRRGYEILGDAHIPPLNFVLPTGKKAKKNAEASKEQSMTCVVTVALAP